MFSKSSNICIIIICLCYLSYLLNAQYDEDNDYIDLSYTNKKYKLSIFYEHNIYSIKSGNLYGINFEYFLSKNISVNYSAGLGINNGNLIAHCYSGFAGSLYFISNNLFSENHDYELSDFTKTLAIICFFIPEGMNFYIKSSEILYLTPYINPLGFDLFSDKMYSLTSGVGIKPVIKLNELFDIGLQFGLRYFYKQSKFIYHTGFSIGLIF